MTDTVYTIGHSNHPIEVFISLLHRHRITALADVRSHPYSRHNPHFNREAIQPALWNAGIAYVFLGRELGARSENPECYVNGKVQFHLLAQEPRFQEGLERVLKGMQSYQVALMCAEKDPLKCHRTILVGHNLCKRGVELLHILADGHVETHEHAEKRLLRLLRLPEGDMFSTRHEILVEAYALQAARIAYESEHNTAPSVGVQA